MQAEAERYEGWELYPHAFWDPLTEAQNALSSAESGGGDSGDCGEVVSQKPTWLPGIGRVSELFAEVYHFLMTQWKPCEPLELYRPPPVQVVPEYAAHFDMVKTELAPERISEDFDVSVIPHKWLYTKVDKDYRHTDDDGFFHATSDVYTAWRAGCGGVIPIGKICPSVRFYQKMICFFYGIKYKHRSVELDDSYEDKLRDEGYDFPCEDNVADEIDWRGQRMAPSHGLDEADWWQMPLQAIYEMFSEMHEERGFDPDEVYETGEDPGPFPSFVEWRAELVQHAPSCHHELILSPVSSDSESSSESESESGSE